MLHRKREYIESESSRMMAYSSIMPLDSEFHPKIRNTVKPKRLMIEKTQETEFFGMFVLRGRV